MELDDKVKELIDKLYRKRSKYYYMVCFLVVYFIGILNNSNPNDFLFVLWRSAIYTVFACIPLGIARKLESLASIGTFMAIIDNDRHKINEIQTQSGVGLLILVIILFIVGGGLSYLFGVIGSI